MIKLLNTVVDNNNYDDDVLDTSDDDDYVDCRLLGLRILTINFAVDY